MHRGSHMMRHQQQPASRPVPARGAYADAQSSLKNATTGATGTPVPSGVGGAAG
jgi:hypothetical protein